MAEKLTRLAVARHALLAALPSLLTGDNTGWGLAGVAEFKERDELLIPALEIAPVAPKAWMDAAGDSTNGRLPVAIHAGKQWTSAAAWADWLDAIAPVPSGIVMVAVSAEGDMVGWVRRKNLQPFSSIQEFNIGRQSITETPTRELGEGRYSRLSGALGAHTLDELQRLHVAVIGVSRTGSRLAHALARLGVKHLTLIDGDAVEPHNADIGEFHPSLDEGISKIKAVHKGISSLLRPGCEVSGFPMRLGDPLPFVSVREADILATCVDDDGARLLAAVIGSAYLRPHLDIGVQVLAGADGLRTAGADIRLTLPGERCIACLGGFADPVALRRQVGFKAPQRLAWPEGRAGSLASINHIAVGLGLRLVERYVAGEISRSTWLRYEDSPMPTLREVVPHHPPSCKLCSSFSGIGDAILEERDIRLRRLVAAIAPS